MNFTISIHAPRVGSDIVVVNGFIDPGAISIHSPRVGSDARTWRGFRPIRHFNPRSPRGERRYTKRVAQTSGHFNPRSPRGERLMA